MHSDVLIVASPGRGPHIECTGALAARRTTPNTVHLVSAAATPLGGDTISIRLVVAAGSCLILRSVAASMVLPGPRSLESCAQWDLQVAGDLDVDLEPTVIAGGSSHHVRTRLQIQQGGRVRLRERVQIGRSGESDGLWSGVVAADVDERPLLRHRVEFGAGSVTDDELAAPRAYVSELRYPDSDFGAIRNAERYESHRNHVVMALAGGGCLATWQGPRL